jgi:ring-1,2-phenylacetyl-CoA epoxidase subunit PaaD
MVTETASERRVRAAESRERIIWQALRTIMDPEIPVLSVVELGIVRYVREQADGRVHVGLTPTYTGCPATEVIQEAVRRRLERQGFSDVVIESVLSPPWSSEWLTQEGRRKLEAFGIAAPRAGEDARIACPRCASRAVERVSEFGSTPCKAHYLCRSCREPFDLFKCI